MSDRTEREPTLTPMGEGSGSSGHGDLGGASGFKEGKRIEFIEPPGLGERVLDYVVAGLREVTRSLRGRTRV